ncbi:hypothetical protein C7212DRAFT_310770, partial [Tuber magnatum]
LAFIVDGPRDDKAALAAWRIRMKIVRLGLSGGADGPTIVATMLVLGKERCMERLKRAIARLDDGVRGAGLKKLEAGSA